MIYHFATAVLLAFSYGNDLNVNDQPDPETIVTEFCKARVALDANRMHQFIADDYHSILADGSKKPYNRSMAFPICEWERGMQTKWTFEVLGTDGNVVTVLLKEQNRYFTLLGLGQGVQVSQYTVVDGKIQSTQSKLFITQRSSQDAEYARFKQWLFTQPSLSEPDLIKPDGGFYFTGASSPVMLKWLEKYDRSRNK